jgi:hypothetical protein
MKTEISFSWDWKEQADVCKILDSAKKIFEETGKFPNCYEVNTLSDSYGILLTIKEYDDAESIRKKWDYLFAESNCSEEEFNEYCKDMGYEKEPQNPIT